MNHTEIYSIFARDYSTQLFDLHVQPNPEELLQTALDRVDEIFAFLHTQYHTDYDEFRAYLQMAQPLLNEKIDRLWEEVDTDIFDHYAHGTLLSFELKAWKKNLRTWRDTVLQAAKEYVKEAFHEHFETAITTTQLVAA